MRKELEDRLEKKIGENQQELINAMSKQTERLIKVLEQYEQKTEKHESLYNRIAEEFKNDKKSK